MFNFENYFEYRNKILNEKDVRDIYNLCKNNEIYYKYIGLEPTIENVREILTEIPPSVSSKNKKCIGFYDTDKLIAILDLIHGYPDCESAFIGLLIIDINYQGRGVGKEIVQSLFQMLKNEGVKRCYLGCIEDNKEAKRFWIKNGFIPTETIHNPDKYSVIKMVKRL